MTDTSTQVRDTSRTLQRRPVTGHAVCVVDESRLPGPEAVREQRETLGLTQQELADRAGVGLSTVIRLESGRRLRGANERKIAEALGWATNGIDAAFRGEPVSTLDADASDAAQVAAMQFQIEDMSDEQMERIADFVAEVRDDPAEKHALMADMIRRRRAAQETRRLTQRDHSPRL